MLPWKKNKFDLTENDKRTKQKGYAVSLNCSALTSFAKSCPQSALYRVGSMFKSKRRKVRITSEDPTYTVLYLGNATTIQSKGDGCIDGAVSKIWSKSEMGKNGTKMKLTISSHGIRMVHMDDKARRPGHLYLLHRITYCVADPRLPKIFAWIYRHEMKHKAVMLRCHSVLVSKPEKAKAMALLLYQTSATALAEFKRLKRRDDDRHQQQQLIGDKTIPLMPIRKILNGQCSYKPPVERSRSAPKLGSIKEDLLGEEEEEKSMHYECENILDIANDCLGNGQKELSNIINDLGEICIGNDVQTLKADLLVTRFLSGESMGSGSSNEISREPISASNGVMETKMQEIG